MTDTAFVRSELVQPMGPPPGGVGLTGWLKKNLFSSFGSTVLTVLSVLFLLWLLPALFGFLFQRAVWVGTPDDCRVENVGACWAFISARGTFLIYGPYPTDQYWRVNVFFALSLALLVPLLWPSVPFKRSQRRAVLRRLPDRLVLPAAWRRLRAQRDFHRSVGRPADHLPAVGRRDHRVVSPRHAPRPRPTIQTADRQDVLHPLHRALAGGAADHRAVHGLGHAAAVHAGGHQCRPPAARPGRRHAVLQRLHGRGDPRRPPGSATWPVRSGFRTWPQLLEVDDLHHPAAGADAW